MELDPWGSSVNSTCDVQNGEGQKALLALLEAHTVKPEKDSPATSVAHRGGLLTRSSLSSLSSLPCLVLSQNVLSVQSVR